MTDLMSPKEAQAAGVKPTTKQKETLEKFDAWIANRRWAEGLTNKELARQLTIELWSIEKFYTRNCALLEETIDRLTKKDEDEDKKIDIHETMPPRSGDVT